MPSLGDLLKSLTNAAGQGVQHQYAQKARGGDYLQREEALGTAQRGRAVAEATAVRGAQGEDAVARALQQLAREGGLELSGDPVQDAALFKAVQEMETRGLGRRLTESQINANDSLAKQREMTPAEKEADRELKRQLAADNAELRRALANAAGNRPQLVVIQTEQGPQVIDKRTAPRGTSLADPPLAAGERRKRAEGAANIGILDQLDQVPDEFLGPTTRLKAGVRQGMIGDVFGMDEPAPEYTNAQAAVGTFRDQLVHALTGAAASVPEMKRLMTHIPDMGQRPNTFRSNVRISKVALEIAESVNAGEVTPEEAKLLISQLVGAVAPPKAGAARPPSIASPGQPVGNADDPLGILR